MSANEKYNNPHCKFTVTIESNSYTCNGDSSCPMWFYYITLKPIDVSVEKPGYYKTILWNEATGRVAYQNLPIKDIP